MHKPISMEKRRQRREAERTAADEARAKRMQTIAIVLFIGMNVAGAIGVYWGWRSGLHGWDLVKPCFVFLSASVMIVVGLLEMEWLERVLFIVEFICLDSWMWLGAAWFGWGNLADNEWIGRRGAQTIWVFGGIVVYAVGWLMVAGVL
jgi:hypothetical protein